MASVVTDLEGLAARLSGQPGAGRRLVAIAGPPGAGKSTVARHLEKRLNAARPGSASVLEMDGYHYDDRLLQKLGRAARKGAPDTFDVGGLAHMLTRLRRNDEGPIAVPVFDREIEIARAGAALIAADVSVILVEGNYLLLTCSPWDRLAGLFDLTIFLDVPRELLRARLLARWRRLGLDEAEGVRKVEENDLPNGDLVVAQSRAADLVLQQEGRR